MRVISRVWRRCTFFFARTYWVWVTAAGLVLVVTAFSRKSWEPWSAIFAGIGCSILATVIVTFAGPAGDPLYQRFLQLGVTEFYPDRDTFPKHRWVEWLREAKEHCLLLGQAHGEWCHDLNFRPALLERVPAGVKVEMFFLNPNSEAAKVRAKEDRTNIKPLLPRIRASIQEAWSIREALGAQEDRFRLYVYDTTPSLGVCWIDDRMLVTHYLAASNNRTSPAFIVDSVPRSDSFYAAYRKNVERIRDGCSTEITRENLADYTEEPHA